MANSVSAIPVCPKILTTMVGSYPVPEWLAASPSEQALTDATRVLFDTQRQAGIDLPTDGELYRFDVNHPDTNGMIDYFVRRFGGCSTAINRSQTEAYAAKFVPCYCAEDFHQRQGRRRKLRLRATAIRRRHRKGLGSVGRLPA